MSVWVYHRRRSVLVRMSQTGEHRETVRILNDRDVPVEVMSRASESPEVVLEAAYGWYWAADALAELGATVHLAHPLGVKAFSYGRVKNDQPRRHRGRSPNARSGVARAEWTTRSARRSHPRQSSRCARVGRPSTLRSKISVCKFPSDNIRTHRSTHRAVADSRKMS